MPDLNPRQFHMQTNMHAAQEHLATWDYTDEHRAQGLRNDAPRPWERRR